MENPVSRFRDLYHLEIQGGLDGHQEICANILERVCRMTGFGGEIGPPERDVAAKLLKNLVSAAVKAGKVRTELPQLHINASLHAALRWDGRRKYKKGDCEDFRHAGSAIPYCHCFLTEASLKHLVSNKPLALDKEYGVAIFDNSGDAVEYLERLV